MVHAIHAIRGRARYAVEGLYRSYALKRYLERHLSQQSFIRTVFADPRTGNVLVMFEPDAEDLDGMIGAIAEHIEKICFNFQQDRQQQPPCTNQRIVQRRKAAVSGAEQPLKDWHKLDSEVVLKAFDTDSQEGLTEETALANQEKYGPNILSESQPQSDLSILIEQFQSPPVALLTAAAGLSVATGGLTDAAVIAGVVGINAIIGYLTESQSERIIRSLQAVGEQTAQVIRAGQSQTIAAESVVPGDILAFQPGHVIAADARLLVADHLSVNESSLTGESVPVSKQLQPLEADNIPLAEHSNMVYKGTIVTGGMGRAVVVATGRFTEIGKIQQLVGEAKSESTPLEQQLDEAGGQLALLSSGVCGLVFVLGWLRGYPLLPMLKTSISLAVAAVPEGLPTIATTTLALGMDDMRKRHIFIRKLQAVEALGSVQTICLDKTGTLTENQMVVREVHIGQATLHVKQGEFIPEGEETIDLTTCEELQRLLQVGSLCSESELNANENDTYTLKGSPTENALIQIALAVGIDVLALREQYPRLAIYLRSDDRNLMSTVHELDEQDLGQQRLVAVKGSPEEVLERCQFWMCDGETLPLDDRQRRVFSLDNERMAGRALRVLGIAFKVTSTTHPEALESHLIWLGLTGMADPIREGVTNLIEDFHRAGIKTVMLTGDQSSTAYAIAKELHLSRQHQIKILDSSDLAGLKPEQQQALFDKVDVFARVSPASKLAIVQALQETGTVVAMTGDGINDMPALKAANVGVAMGSGSSSGSGNVVHDVADVVIDNNNLQTLINAVSRGRTTYNNIRKSVHFLLSTNLGEIIVTTLVTAAGLGQPLNTMELLWLNLVTDVFPGLGLALEPPEPDILSQPPRNPNESILKPSDFSRIALESTVISVCAMAAYGVGLGLYGISKRASTILFMSLTISQILHTWSCRSETHSIFHRQPLPRNLYVEAAIAGSLGLQLLPIFLPPLRNLLQLIVLDPTDWGIVFSSAILALIINESTKALSFSAREEE